MERLKNPVEANLAEEEDDSDFEDAQDNLAHADMDLETSLEDARVAVHHFFNNNFTEARKALEPWAKTSMYHALGIGVFEYLEAILTFEHTQIMKASEALKDALNICDRYRRKNTFSNTLGKMVGRGHYESYTEIEAHAELIFAEGLLLKAVLTFIEDETLVSFIKASIKIRSCYNTYKECNMVLKTQTWANEKNIGHYESGVKMGIGAFNVMISLLPSGAKKLLELIGFAGSRQFGLQELEEGFKIKNGLRQVLCVMTLLGYHLVVTYVLSHKDGDLELCEQILKEQLVLYPKGVWFLLFKGRLELMKGNLDDAEKWYTKSWKSQELWRPIHHLCFWELMWTNCLRQDWRESCSYATRLLAESKWSRTIYSYQKASQLIMLGSCTSRDEKNEMEQLMRDVPLYKQKIAGKSVPLEKFCIRRAERYFAQKKWLCLPAIELMFLWNFFKILGKNRELIHGVYKLVETELSTLERGDFYEENKALLHLLRGALLRQMNAFLQAEESLKYVVENGKKLKDDLFLAPYAVVELALLEIDRLDYRKAQEYLDAVRRSYAGYPLASRLNFKIHAANKDILERDTSIEATRM